MSVGEQNKDLEYIDSQSSRQTTNSLMRVSWHGVGVAKLLFSRISKVGHRKKGLPKI